MSNREFQDWFIYEQLQPFGEKRDDLRAGIAWATLCNIYRAKNSTPISPLEYPLIKEMKTEQEKANELHAKFLMFKQKYESIQPS